MFNVCSFLQIAAIKVAAAVMACKVIDRAIQVGMELADYNSAVLAIKVVVKHRAHQWVLLSCRTVVLLSANAQEGNGRL